MQFQPKPHHEYRLVSALKDDMVLDVAASNKVLLYSWHKGANQRFKIHSVGNGKYTLTSVQHQIAVGIPHNSSQNGAELEVFKSQKSNGELWELVACNNQEYYGKNAYYLRSHCGKTLDVAEGKAKNEQKIIQWDYNGDKNQIWFLEPVSFVPQQNVAYHLVTALNKKRVLDKSGNPDDNNKMLLYKKNGQDNQKFYITEHNGKYMFKTVSDGLVLQVSNGSGDNGALLHGSHSSNKAHELFELIPSNQPKHKEENAFYIKTHNGKAMDVAGAKDDDETEIIQWDFNGNVNQVWYIQKAD